MNMTLLLAAIALGAAVIVLLQNVKDPFRIAAVVVAGVWLVLSLGLIRLSIPGVSLMLVLGGVLAGLGVFLWLRNSTKMVVTACTVMILLGGQQVLAVLF